MPATEAAVQAPTEPASEVSAGSSLKRDGDGAYLFDPFRVRYFPENPRKKFRRIPELAESIKKCGQRQPGEVILVTNDPACDAELVDGERRLRACRLARVKFRAYSKSDIVDVNDQFEKSFASNFGKENLDCIEIAHTIERIMTTRNRTLLEVAQIAGKSITWASQHHSLLKLAPEIQEMLIPAENEELDSDRKLNFSLALLLIDYPPHLQLKAARTITREQMNIVKARRFILQLGRAAGHEIQHRRNKPRAKFESLMGLSEKLRDSVGIFLDMKDDELTAMLNGANPESQVLLLERLVEFDGEVTQLITALQRKIGPDPLK